MTESTFLGEWHIDHVVVVGAIKRFRAGRGGGRGRGRFLGVYTCDRGVDE